MKNNVRIPTRDSNTSMIGLIFCLSHEVAGSTQWRTVIWNEPVRVICTRKIVIEFRSKLVTYWEFETLPTNAIVQWRVWWTYECTCIMISWAWIELHASIYSVKVHLFKSYKLIHVELNQLVECRSCLCCSQPYWDWPEVNRTRLSKCIHCPLQGYLIPSQVPTLCETPIGYRLRFNPPNIQCNQD